MPKTVLITGSCGYMGSLFVKHCSKNTEFNIITTDLKEPTAPIENTTHYALDIRSSEIEKIFKNHPIDIVVHLAAILSSADSAQRELEYSVEVEGTKKLFELAEKYGVKKFICTTSGSAYGYFERNVNYLLKETDSLDGNYEIPYAYHKKLIDEFLQEKAKSQSKTNIFVFRASTVLGKTTRNHISELFTKKRILNLVDADSPFVFIWDQDLVQILQKACEDGKPGIYNVAADGLLSMSEIAKMLGKKNLNLRTSTLRNAFRILHPIGLSKHGPISVAFLQYRPILNNTKLKEEFGYIPQKTSHEVFQYFIDKNPDYINLPKKLQSA